MTYPTRTGLRTPPQAASQENKAMQLTGMNSDDPTKRAVTRGDVASLGALTLKASHVSSAPTAAQYNALVDDLRTIAAILNSMGANFTGL